MLLNDNDDVVVYGQASDGVDLVQGLWARAPGGTLRLVLRENDTIDVDNGPGTDLRRLWFLEMQSRAPGYPYSFNNRNELAVRARFQDGTGGLFVITIPEPSTVALGAILLIDLLIGRCARLKTERLHAPLRVTANGRDGAA
jgi:hypothetical protein